MAPAKKATHVFVLLTLVITSLPDRAVAETLLCFKKFQNIVSSRQGQRVRHAQLFRVVDTGTCPRGYLPLIDTAEFRGPQGPQGEDGLQGVQGPQGTQGIDGVIGIYGDGTAGSPTINDAATLTPNLQYEDFTINNGVSVTAESGLVIRATGTCSVNGEITVNTAARGGNVLTRDATEGDSHPSRAMPHPGNSLGAPALGSSGPEDDVLSGGQHGLGHTEATARALLRPGIFGGGAGAGGTINNPNFNTRAGSGGGTITLLCRAGITVSGAILAEGEDSLIVGGGGGGGGIIILATPGPISKTGTLSVDGGRGGAADVVTAAGGGGGGGIIHFIYGTNLENGGLNSVFGGLAGSQVAVVSLIFRTSGGGGGASFGNGGNGGDLLTNAAASTGAQPGSAGIVLTTEADPTALFF